jgi:hypothetical protein
MTYGIHLRGEQRESDGTVPLIVPQEGTRTTVNVLRCAHHTRGKKLREHFPCFTRKGGTYDHLSADDLAARYDERSRIR